MWTIIDIDDQLLKYAKLQATRQDCTLKQVIGDALHYYFSHHRIETEPVKLETVSGAGQKPWINLYDGGSLNDIYG